MSGAKFLLDTNIIIGLHKRTPDALASVRASGALTSESGYSAITRMELLGFPDITDAETTALQTLLAKLVYFPLTTSIEDATIALRRLHRIKLPDAIVVATAKVYHLHLLTLDKGLMHFIPSPDISQQAGHDH